MQQIDEQSYHKSLIKKQLPIAVQTNHTIASKLNNYWSCTLCLKAGAGHEQTLM